MPSVTHNEFKIKSFGDGTLYKARVERSDAHSIPSERENHHVLGIITIHGRRSRHWTGDLCDQYRRNGM